MPTEWLGGLEGDEPVRTFIMARNREISEKSGRPVLQIERVEAKKK